MGSYQNKLFYKAIVYSFFAREKDLEATAYTYCSVGHNFSFGFLFRPVSHEKCRNQYSFDSPIVFKCRVPSFKNNNNNNNFSEMTTSYELV